MILSFHAFIKSDQKCCNNTPSFYSEPTCSPHLPLPSMAKQLLLLWVMWMDLVSWVLWRPLKPCRQICRGHWDGWSSVQGYRAQQNKTDDDRFHLGLRGFYCLLHAQKSKVGSKSRVPSKSRVFLTVLCFESTRTWHMPQIVCSQHAADPCSVVIGDRALLSAAESVCATKMFMFASVCFHTCVFVCEGEH